MNHTSQECIACLDSLLFVNDSLKKRNLLPKIYSTKFGYAEVEVDENNDLRIYRPSKKNHIQKEEFKDFLETLKAGLKPKPLNLFPDWGFYWHIS